MGLTDRPDNSWSTRGAGSNHDVLFSKDSTGYSTIYDDRAGKVSMDWRSQPTGTEVDVRSLIIELTQTVRVLYDEIRLLKDELLNRPLVTSLLIENVNDRRFRIKRPISIIVEETPEECIARWPEVNAFGIGATVKEAIRNLKGNIAELYLDIAYRKTETLGDIAVETLAIMTTYLEENK